jgi:phage regulator Rha-like protein
MADVRPILVELHGEGGVLTFQDPQVNPQNGQSYLIFKLPKRETLILVSGYSVAMRAKIIDRWQELEEQALPAQPIIPQSLPEALRLAADLVEMKAKADAALADGSFCIRDAAKTLQVNERTSKQTLLGRRWVHLSLVVRHPRLLQHLNHRPAVPW